MAENFTCTLVTPEEAVFEVDVTSVTVPAHDGQIGILTNRAPLLAKLGYGKLTVTETGGQAKTYFVASGFAQMQDNKLSILTDEAIDTAELNAQEAQAQLDAAVAEEAGTPAEQIIKQKKIARARGLVTVAAS